MGSKKGQALCCLELIVLPPLGGLGLSGQMCVMDRGLELVTL